MSGDPTIAPSAARERKAFLAGLRPRTRWLVRAGLAAGLVVLLADAEAGEIARAVGLVELEHAPQHALALGVQRLLHGTASIAALVLCVVVVVAIVGGGLGWVSPAERRRLASAPVRPPVVLALGGSVALVVGALALLRGTVAGAARAPAASEAGLAALLGATASSVLVGVAGLLAVAGIVELLASRHANWRALHQTEAQARAEARASGGRRG